MYYVICMTVQHIVCLPDSVGRVISLLLPELVECVVDGAADLLTDLSELLAEGEGSSALVPVLIPLTTIQLIGWKEEHRKAERERERERERESERENKAPSSSTEQCCVKNADL